MKVNPKFIFKLALTNMKKNIRTIVPFIISSSIMIMLFYIMDSLSRTGFLVTKGGGEVFYGAATIAALLSIGKGIVILFAFGFILYANRFVMRSRKREMGLYGILGLSKKHIGAILFVENVITSTAAIGLGIIVGTFLNKIMLLVLYKLVGQKPLDGLVFSTNALIFTIVGFEIGFFICYLYNVLSVNFGKPIALLKSENMGEKEPKTRYILLIAGTVCLGIGYVIALSAKDTFSALSVLFQSIFFVILGTYFLFVAGSIFVLKMLKKKKKFYYNTKNFISVSNLMFRMKHNAVGLASICVLSTAVIILFSCCASISFLGEQNINMLFPKDTVVVADANENFDRDKFVKTTEEVCKDLGIEMCDEETAQYTQGLTFFGEDGYEPMSGPRSNFTDFASITDTYVLTSEEYKYYTGEDLSVGPGEIYIKECPKEILEAGHVQLLGDDYKIKGELGYEDIKSLYEPEMMLFSKLVIVADDENLFEKLDKDSLKVGANEQKNFNHISNVEFNLVDKDRFDKVDLLQDEIAQKGVEINEVRNKQEYRSHFYSIYGGVLFVGGFLSVVFLLATAMIIYYKQMSEGLEDRRSFDILKKVGLTEKEAKKTIRTQIMTMFLLPVLASIIHSIFASSIIRLFLNSILYVDIFAFSLCISVACVSFFLVYILVYLMTSKQYYETVYGRSEAA